jgi:surface antigen
MKTNLAGKGVRGIVQKTRRLLLGAACASVSLLFGHAAQASTRHTAHPRHTLYHHPVYHSATHLAASHYRSHVEHFSARREAAVSHYRYHRAYGYRVEHGEYYPRPVHYAARFRASQLQCVPYAREVSHIDLTGNAFLWWAEAAGRYERGSTPVEGAVLNFRGVGRMPLGHVAVVTSVIDSRTVLVTQANWVPGSITNDVAIQDVSPDNDWTEVRVELGDSSTWGAPYPTYGFIYNRPADSTIIAANGQSNEVAEAPAATPVSAQAPDRNLQ